MKTGFLVTWLKSSFVVTSLRKEAAGRFAGRPLVCLDFVGSRFAALSHVVVVLVFHSPSTLSGHFGRSQLTYPHCSWASLLCSLPVLSDVTSNIALQRKKYRHSFCRPEKMIFVITNLNILYIILLSPKFWTCVCKIRQFWADYRLRFVAQNLRANVKMACSLLRKTP